MHKSFELFLIVLKLEKDLGEKCYQFDTFGYCPNGIMCRFGDSHIDKTTGKSIKILSDVKERVLEKNILRKEIQYVLRKKQFDSYYNQEKEKKKTQEFDSTPLGDKTVKLVDFSNKVYVAPLTTVGNLPFRRILLDYGADITCGEVKNTFYY